MYVIVSRLGVAGAVLQTASSLIDSFIHPFPPNLVAEFEQVSPLSLKRCVSAWELGKLNCAN